VSRPRTPLHILEASGATKKNPQRYRERQEEARNAPKAEPVGPPPDYWNVPTESMGSMKLARWKAIWIEFAPQVTIRTPMRRSLLEQYVIAMDRFRRSAISGEKMATSEKNNLLALTVKLELDQRIPGVGKGVRGTDGAWEEYG
jgi:hypothetical protein